jgi:hypothetical protein
MKKLSISVENKLHKKFTKPTLLIVLSGVVSYLYVRVAPLQVDPSHDGLMLSAAIGVSEGRDVLSEVFSQYGPLPPLINGFVVSIFGTHLLVLRYFAAAQCLVTGILIYLLSKKVTSKELSQKISLFWILCSAIWSTSFPGALLAWPSITATILTMMGLLFLAEQSSNGNTLFPFVAGALFSLAGFCRIQAFVIVPMLFLCTSMKFPKKRKVIISCISGYFVAIAAFVLYMILNKNIDDFINQVIVTPLLSYSGVGAEQHYNRFQIPMYLIKSTAFLLIVSATSYVISKTKSIFASIPLIVILLSTLMIFGKSILGLDIPIRIRVLLGEAWSDILLAPYYFSAVASILMIYLVMKRKSRILNFNETIISIVSLGMIVQLYPQPDVMHLWWIAPVLILTIPITMSLIQKQEISTSLKFSFLRNIYTAKSISTILIAMSLVGAFQGVVFVTKDWSEYSLPVLQGTYAESEKVKNQRIFDVIPKYAIPQSSSFDCLEGIYSVAAGKYLATDQWFVNWGNNKKESQNLGTVRFICDKTKNYALMFARENNFKLVYFAKNPNNSIAILKQVNNSER